MFKCLKKVFMNSENLNSSSKYHRLDAYFIANDINIKLLSDITQPSAVDPRGSSKMSIRDGEFAFIFAHGSVVFCNVPKSEHKRILERITNKIGIEGYDYKYHDSYVILEGGKANKVDFDNISLSELTPARIELIATTLAQSCSMEHYENIVDSSWKNSLNLVKLLRNNTNFKLFSYPINNKVADSLELRSEVVRALHLLDKPDIIWEDKEMSAIYEDLRTMFDLDERFQAIEHKIQLIQETLTVVVDTIRYRKTYWIEIAIVSLIMFEIVLSLLHR